MEQQTESALREALKHLEAGAPDEAAKVLSPLFEYEFDCPQLVFSSGCCNFWIRRMQKADECADPFERGEVLLTSWKEFMGDFVPKRAGAEYPPTVQAAMRGVFQSALKDYEKVVPVTALSLRRAAMSCKKLGLYDKALGYLSRARRMASAISTGGAGAAEAAEMADCYALCGEDRKAKLLFREAFLISPDEIDLDLLDSKLIRILIEQTAAKGYKGLLLGRWVAVWGTLWGVFCIRRDIKAAESSRLRQEIFSLENEMSGGTAGKELIVPRLLNLYFWYIDYLSLIRGKEDRAEKMIDDVLLKIKILDKDVYNIYVR